MPTFKLKILEAYFHQVSILDNEKQFSFSYEPNTIMYPNKNHIKSPVIKHPITIKPWEKHPVPVCLQRNHRNTAVTITEDTSPSVANALVAIQKSKIDAKKNKLHIFL